MPVASSEDEGLAWVYVWTVLAMNMVALIVACPMVLRLRNASTLLVGKALGAHTDPQAVRRSRGAGRGDGGREQPLSFVTVNPIHLRRLSEPSAVAAAQQATQGGVDPVAAAPPRRRTAPPTTPQPPAAWGPPPPIAPPRPPRTPTAPAPVVASLPGARQPFSSLRVDTGGGHGLDPARNGVPSLASSFLSRSGLTALPEEDGDVSDEGTPLARTSRRRSSDGGQVVQAFQPELVRAQVYRDSLTKAKSQRTLVSPVQQRRSSTVADNGFDTSSEEEDDF